MNMEGGVVYRDGKLGDVEEVVLLHRLVRARDLPYLPDLHTIEEDILYFQNIIFVEDSVAIAECEGRIVGFCAFRKGMVDYIYVTRDFQGRGVGKRLLDWAKKENDVLELWVFQKNVKAQEFYEREGFVQIKETDGSHNEEKEPDVLYMWKK